MGTTDPGIPGRDLRSEDIPPNKRSTYWKQGRYLYEKFSGGQPIIMNAAAGKALWTAAQGQTDIVLTPGGNYIEEFQTTAQTLQPLAHATKGIEIALDQVDNESVEYVPGGNRTTNPLAMVLGTDPSFFIRAKFEITDADGMDQFLLGWRKVQAFGVPTSFLTTGDGVYTDFAGIGFAKVVANPNPVSVASDLNNSGSATVSQVSFTWADTLVHTLEMRVVKRIAQFLINGVPLGGTVSKDGDGATITAQATAKPHTFTFDTGDTVIPFIFLRQDSALSPVYIQELEIGHLQSIEADPDQRGA
jgi:hypothetical protein